MSGGFFDYKQWHINNIADSIEHEVIRSGKPIPRQRWQYWEIDRFKSIQKKPLTMPILNPR